MSLRPVNSLASVNFTPTPNINIARSWSEVLDDEQSIANNYVTCVEVPGLGPTKTAGNLIAGYLRGIEFCHSKLYLQI